MPEPEKIFDFYVYGSKQINANYYRPAELFEEQAQVTGIVGSYVFPGGWRASDYEAWLNFMYPYTEKDSPKVRAELKATWNELAQLNPTLSIVKPDDDFRVTKPHGKYSIFRDALRGATSLLNPNDIRFFIEMENAGEKHIPHRAAFDPAYKLVENAIRSRTGKLAYWVPAPETLVQIYNQLKDRPQRYNVCKVFIAKPLPPPSAAIKQLLAFPPEFKFPA